MLYHISSQLYETDILILKGNIVLIALSNIPYNKATC